MLDVLALISAVAAVVSAVAVPIGYLQLRAARASRQNGPAGEGRSLAAALGDSMLFAPNARFLGFDIDLVDRRSELATLTRYVEAGRSVITIEGIAGVGKTALAARLCRRAGRSRKVRWVFCDEKGESFGLVALAKALAFGVDSPSAGRLRAAVQGSADTSVVIDAVVDLLSTQRLLLVLDNYHTVDDTDIDALLTRLRHSQTRSSVVLTSRLQARDRAAVPLAGQLALDGLAAADARELLRDRGVDLPDGAAALVWRRTGDGNPLALTMFAGRAAGTDAAALATRLPDWVDEVDEWIALALDGLKPDVEDVAKLIAFSYEPVPRDAVRAILAPSDPGTALRELLARFLVKENAGSFEMHPAVRAYVSGRTTDAEQAQLARRYTDHYRSQARTMFVEGLGDDHPAYGTLYLESFPDYFAATQRHALMVDDLLARLADNGFALDEGAGVLVLGSGDGTHDPALARHGFTVTNVELQPEIADLGRAKAAGLPATIEYVVADMTEPLTLPPNSADAVFNIGSSFGYEDSDEANSTVFRNAASVLRDDRPFVFEYVNGPHWESKRVQRQVDVTTLPNGSTRTEVSITNPDARTSLTLIGLQRPDGTGGWFRHFMRYYRLPEIISMMAEAGLRPVATYGAVGGRVTGAPFDEATSEAMVVIATRSQGGTAGR